MVRRFLNTANLQRFLIAVAFWVLVLLSAQGIHDSQTQPIHHSGRIISMSLSLTPSNSRAIGGRPLFRTEPTTQPAITAWRGPIQPVIIQPSDKVPVFLRIPTTEPVVFVGIDDGWIQSPQALKWLTQHHLPFSLFLTYNGIKNDFAYFKKLQNAGMIIEDHTLSHPHLAKLNLDQQKAEICGTADVYKSVFGQRPTLFRPPYGEYNDVTRSAAASCGMKALVMWHSVIGTGGEVQFQDKNNHLQPGDIVLMHFTPQFLADIKVFAQQAAANHLQIGRLEDWLP